MLAQKSQISQETVARYLLSHSRGANLTPVYNNPVCIAIGLITTSLPRSSQMREHLAYRPDCEQRDDAWLLVLIVSKIFSKDVNLRLTVSWWDDRHFQCVHRTVCLTKGS